MPKIEADFEIRLAVAADAEALPEIELSSGEAFRAVPGLEWIADDEITPGTAFAKPIAAGTVWVAARGPALAGFVTAERYEDDLHVAQASVLYDLQGQGLGRRLLTAAIDHARAEGLNAVTLTTFRDLAWNAPFYASLGFAIVEPPEAGERLRAVLNAEAARGLPAERRCAMRLPLQT